MDEISILKFHFSIPSSLVDMSTGRMIKWNQERSFSGSLSLHMCPQASECWFLSFFMTLLTAISLCWYHGLIWAFLSHVWTPILTSWLAPWLPSALPSQLTRPSQLKNPNDSLFCLSQSNPCIVLHTLQVLAPSNLPNHIPGTPLSSSSSHLPWKLPPSVLLSLPLPPIPSFLQCLSTSIKCPPPSGTTKNPFLRSSRTETLVTHEACF